MGSFSGCVRVGCGREVVAECCVGGGMRKGSCGTYVALMSSLTFEVKETTWRYL